MTKAFEDTWLSDDPLRDLEDELFGRSHLAERALEVLARVSEQSTSSTIGLVGSWGSGKSSVLNGLIKRLNNPDDFTCNTMGRQWRVAEFNPWLSSSPAALYSNFFRALRDALPEDAQWNETKDNLLTVGRRLAPLGALGGLFGVDAQGAVEKALDALTDDVVTKRDKIAKALEELKQPILVVVDDLDRLTSEELLHVFKLVRLLGRLPYVYYVLSYDEHTLLDLLSHTDLVATQDQRRALDYLEKIVQVRIDMPLLRPFEVDRIVARAVTFLAKKYGVALAAGELDAIIRRFDEVLSKRLRTPRAIKRVFGQVDAFLGSVGTEVDFGDYLVVTWLRTMEPGVYRLIQQRRTELLGVGGISLRSMDAPAASPEQVRVEWLKTLRNAHVAEPDTEDILWLLGTLFDSLARVYRSEDPKKSGSRPEPGPGKLQHPYYFDRFFAFGVPADDLPDVVADAAVADLVAGALSSAAVQQVTDTFSTQPDLVLAKINRAIGATSTTGPGLVTWLLRRWEGEAQGFGRGRIENLAATALTKLQDELIPALFKNVMSADHGLNFAAAVFHAVSQDAYGAPEVIARREKVSLLIEPLVLARYVERFDELLATTDSPLNLELSATNTMWYWRHQDPASLRDFLARAMTNGWPVLDTLAWLVPRSSSDGKTWKVGFHMSTAHFEELFDLDAVAAALPELATATNFHDLKESEATPDALRMWALAAVTDVLARRPASTPDEAAGGTGQGQ